MEFLEEMEKQVAYAEAVLAKYMPKDTTYQKTVADAMAYTVSAGGKRIRPVLMKAVFDLLGGRGEEIEPFMAAIEMIHTYSLIHDDLPALDNDDYRRGRKTAHIVYGEAMAILAGDSLLNYAYETAARAFFMEKEAAVEDLEQLSKEKQIECLRSQLENKCNLERAMAILAEKPGIYGMIGGQVADVELTGKRLTEGQLTYIYENKTGALIEAAMLIGAVLANGDERQIENIGKMAYNIGMAFQIQDDILDETATFEELGKPIHSDEKNEKVTYVTLHGIDESKKEVKRLSLEAVELLEGFEGNTEFLEALILYLIQRGK